jgi:hypothetical protein
LAFQNEKFILEQQALKGNAFYRKRLERKENDGAFDAQGNFGKSQGV